MSPSSFAALKDDRPLKSLAAVRGVSRRRHDTWSAGGEGFDALRKHVCYRSFTRETLAVRGSSARTARVMTTTSLRRPATEDMADTHDGALFHRLEEFFRARRAELRANIPAGPA
jgi:hypothetical protein